MGFQGIWNRSPVNIFIVFDVVQNQLLDSFEILTSVLTVVSLQLLLMVCCIEADSKTLSVRWGGGGKGKKRRIITAYFLSCACYPRFRSFYPKDYIVFFILMLYLLVWRSIIDIIIYIYCMYVYARARVCDRDEDSL